VPVLTYLDFDLLIERARDRYRARVLSSPGGNASRTFDLPFSREQLQIFVLTATGLGKRRKVRRIESPEMQAIKAFGSQLFEAVFDEEVHDCLRLSLHDAERDGTGLRIRLRLDDSVDTRETKAGATEDDETVALCDVPWEFLYDSGGPGFLCLSSGSPVVRYQDLRRPIEPIAVEPPLRILVTICGPSDAFDLDVEYERAKVEQALAGLVENGLVMIDWMERGTLEQLQRRLRLNTYHAFHFIGHGGYDPRGKEGLLLFENANGKSNPVSSESLRTLFQNHQTLQLAVLNACEGARTDPTDPFAGVAQNLLRGGVNAVIAMQFEISDDAAIVLSSEFYTALADGLPVDAALAEARTAVFTRASAVEWATPVLYLRSPDAAIFDVTAPPPPPPAGDVESGEEQGPPKRTHLIDVSREEEKRKEKTDEDKDDEEEGEEEKKKKKKKEEKKSFFERLSRGAKLSAVAALVLIVGAVVVVMALTDNEPVVPGESVGPTASLGGAILFVRNGDILALDPSDQTTRRLVAAEANAFAPSLSPDQTKIVFGGGPEEDIYTARTDGSGRLRNLTNTADWKEETAAWSPDEPKIAFDREMNGNFDIFVMNADGTGEPRQLTSDEADDKRPDWSPDGSLIIFEHFDSNGGDIFVMDANGEDERPLYESDSDAGVPVWSPHGEWIAFRSDRNHPRHYEVWIVRRDGSEAQEITRGDESVRAPAWSPDGKKIVYSRGSEGQHDLFIVDVATGVSTPLLTTPGDDRGATWCCYTRQT
jgi:CHAT domain-containing protein/WD40 repeat protein